MDAALGAALGWMPPSGCGRSLEGPVFTVAMAFGVGWSWRKGRRPFPEG